MGDRGACELLGRGWYQIHRNYPESLARSKGQPQTTHLLDCLLRKCLRVGPVFWLCFVFEKHMERQACG